MLFQNFIILPSILYITTGQETTETPLWTDSEISNLTSSTSKSPLETVGTPEVCSRVDHSINGTKWHCSNGECTDIDKKCDGVFDCEDGSDEYLETCRHEEPRQLFGLILHCSSFWTHKHEFVCPQICQKSPEFCYYALMAENKENNTCILPNYPTNGTYEIMPTNETDVWGRVNFWLKYKCQEPQVVVQKKLMYCTEGNWGKSDPEENAYCSDACDLNKNSNFTYICPKDVYGSTECDNFVAIRTSVNVSRATQDKNNPYSNVSLEILCSEDQRIHYSTSCVAEVERMQENFENPSMLKMTEFENKFNQVKANETNSDFEKLVVEFHQFESEVRGNLSLMHTKAEKCDISLDLLLYKLQLNKEEKNK